MGRQVTDEDRWRKLLVEGHRPMRISHHVFRHVPAAPRCKLCHNPFGGIGGRVLRYAGFTPSRKNPNLCSRCCDALPSGGAEVDVAVLFADVRGSTALGERESAAEFAARMNRFYSAATAALVRHDAIIDKLLGDEVMALFIPGIAGGTYRRRAVDAAVDLVRAVGYGTREGPWLEVGVSVNAGVAFVGNVGDAVVDFTALGDPVNVGARMQGEARGGEIVVAEDVDASLAAAHPHAERRVLALRGHEAVVPALVLRP